MNNGLVRLGTYSAFIALLGVVALDADACSVPVFRYALDRWAPDAYRLEAPATALAIEPLASDLRGDGGARLNIQAHAPADDTHGEYATLRRPAEDGEADPLWTGELTAAAYRTLTESPARTEIARRILAGETAVWVLVESGQPAPDAAAAKLLDEQLAAAEQTLQLPVIRPDDATSRIGPGPMLRIKFSVLRVRRDAAGEQALLAMLAGPGGLAALPTDAPFAAPVFGRGRVLGAWSPEKLSAELIGQATRFLVGACSCEAKELNVGSSRVDLQACKLEYSIVSPK